MRAAATARDDYASWIRNSETDHFKGPLRLLKKSVQPSAEYKASVVNGQRRTDPKSTADAEQDAWAALWKRDQDRRDMLGELVAWMRQQPDPVDLPPIDVPLVGRAMSTLKDDTGLGADKLPPRLLKLLP